MNPEDDFLLGPTGTPAPSGENRFVQSLLGQGDYSDSAFILPFAYTPDGEAVLSFPMAIQGIAQGGDAARRVGGMAFEGMPIDPMTGLPTQDVIDDVVEAGLTFTGGSLLAPRPANSLGMGGRIKPPTKEELDPMGYSNIKLDQPISEVEFDMAPRSLLIPERKIVGPEALQGKIMLFGPGDRTGVGLLTGVEGRTFDTPVEALGGRDYQLATPYAWASDEGVITGLLNRAKKAQQETGIEDVFLAHSTMNPQSVDFTEMMSSTVAEMLKTAKITKKDAKSFDVSVREKFPDFPGVKSDGFREWMASQSGATRKDIITRMDNSKRRAEGFPFIGKARYALTEEAQRNVPTFASGMSFIPIDVEAGAIRNPIIDHGSYNTSMGALGPPVQLPGTVPNDLFYRDFFKTLEGAVTKSGDPQPMSMKQYTTRLTNPYQVMDQQQVDNLAQFLAEGGI